MYRRLYIGVLILLWAGFSGCVHSHVIDNRHSYEPAKFNTLYDSGTPIQGEIPER